MIKSRSKRRPIEAAQRGQIVQRVLVEGQTPKEAALAFDVDERWVSRWVADFRRRGMASLRDGESAPDRAYRMVLRRWQAVVLRLFAASRWEAPAAPAPCVVLRRTGDDLPRRR